jgi:hypothetical protein
MRRLLPLLVIALLASCASSPQLGAGATVALDACGQPVVTTQFTGVPAGPAPWQADVTTTVYRPCNPPPPEAPDAADPR